MRIVDGGGGIEIGDLESRHQILFPRHLRGAGWKHAGLARLVDRDLVFDRAGRARDGDVAPPVASVARVGRLVGHFRHLRRPNSDSAGALGIGTVAGVIEKHLEAGADRVGLGENLDGRSVIDVLRRRMGAGPVIKTGRRIVIDESGRGRILRIGAAAVYGRAAAGVGLGSGRTKGAARGVHRGKLFRALAIHVCGLLVAEEDIGRDRRRMVAFSARVGAEAGRRRSCRRRHRAREERFPPTRRRAR